MLELELECSFVRDEESKIFAYKVAQVGQNESEGRRPGKGRRAHL